MGIAQSAPMTDDDVDRFIADPALITTHEQALEILETLDDEIASIQAQVDAAQIESNAKPLSPDRLAWVQRASYACAMRRNMRHRVMQRDKELRGTKNWGGKPKDPDKKEANIIKQRRLADEVAIRKATKLADVLRLQNEREALAQQRREFHANNEAANLKARIRGLEDQLSVYQANCQHNCTD